MSALRQEGTKCQNIWNGLNKCVRSKSRITTAVRIDLGTIERTIECRDKRGEDNVCVVKETVCRKRPASEKNRAWNDNKNM